MCCVVGVSAGVGHPIAVVDFCDDLGDPFEMVIVVVQTINK